MFILTFIVGCLEGNLGSIFLNFILANRFQSRLWIIMMTSWHWHVSVLLVFVKGNHQNKGLQCSTSVVSLLLARINFLIIIWVPVKWGVLLYVHVLYIRHCVKEDRQSDMSVMTSQFSAIQAYRFCSTGRAGKHWRKTSKLRISGPLYGQSTGDRLVLLRDDQ